MANTNSTFPFLDCGGGGESLYFLHANGYPPECYLPLLETFANSHHVIGMKLRPLWEGHETEVLTDWQPLSDDLVHFLKQQNDPKAIFVGHSLGAVVSLRAAIQEPGFFRALVLLDPVIFPPAVIRGWEIIKSLGLGYKLHPLIPTAQKRRRVFENQEVVYRAYRQKKIFRFIDNQKLKTMIAGMLKPINGKGYELSYSPEWEVQIYYTGVSSDMDIWRGLPQVKIPILIIRGSETNTFFPVTAKRIKKKLPTVRVETISKATHLVPLERPTEVSKIILDFLETVQ